MESTMRSSFKPRLVFKSFLCDNAFCCKRAVAVVPNFAGRRWEVCRRHKAALVSILEADRKGTK